MNRNQATSFVCEYCGELYRINGSTYIACCDKKKREKLERDFAELESRYIHQLLHQRGFNEEN